MICRLYRTSFPFPLYATFQSQSQSPNSSPSFPSAKIGKSQLPFYPFRTLSYQDLRGLHLLLLILTYHFHRIDSLSGPPSSWVYLRMSPLPHSNPVVFLISQSPLPGTHLPTVLSITPSTLYSWSVDRSRYSTELQGTSAIFLACLL